MQGLRQSTFTYKSRGFDLEITVSEATALAGLKRQILIARGRDAHQNAIESGDQAPGTMARIIFDVLTYPNIVAGTVAIKNGAGAERTLPENPDELRPEDVASLPEDLVILWEHEIVTLNGHWSQIVDTEATRKKGRRTSDS